MPVEARALNTQRALIFAMDRCQVAQHDYPAGILDCQLAKDKASRGPSISRQRSGVSRVQKVTM